MIKNFNPADVLGNPLELPCGVILKNRLAKSAMSDSLGNGEGDPTAAQIRLYERWAEGGTALSIIGEVQGDPRFPEKPGNLVLGLNTNQQAIQSLSRRAVIGVLIYGHNWDTLVPFHTCRSVTPAVRLLSVSANSNVKVCLLMKLRNYHPCLQEPQDT